MLAKLATEDVLIIETPEHVHLPFALGSIGNRFLAWAINHGLQALTITVMLIAFSVIANHSSLGKQFSKAPAQHKSNQAINEEQARTELAAVLAERDQAAEKKDIERFLSFYAVDFTWRFEGGKILTRQEIEQVFRLITSSDVLEHNQRSTINSIKVQGNEAVLNVHSYSFVKHRLHDGSIKEATSSDEKRETWVKTEHGWK